LKQEAPTFISRSSSQIEDIIKNVNDI